MTDRENGVDRRHDPAHEDWLFDRSRLDLRSAAPMDGDASTSVQLPYTIHIDSANETHPVPPRCALSGKFYAGGEGKSMRVELWF